MYVCLCNGITDGQIRQAARDGARTLEAVRMKLGVAAGCGSCACMAEQILHEDGPAPGQSSHGAVFAPEPSAP
jgi:bacterioferritin-associated ferredoxin